MSIYAELDYSSLECKDMQTQSRILADFPHLKEEVGTKKITFMEQCGNTKRIRTQLVKTEIVGVYNGIPLLKKKHILDNLKVPTSTEVRMPDDAIPVIVSQE